jgi:ParB/RepB/Spo0J family partition protein
LGNAFCFWHEHKTGENDMFNINDLEVGAQFDCPMVDLSADPNQPRTNKPAEYITELGVSIARHGLSNPIHVRRNPSGEGFVLVNGECRYLAHINNKELREKGTIRAILKEFANERDIYLNQVVDNDARLNLAPMEQARSWAKAVNDLGIPIAELASAVGKAENTVKSAIRLVGLPADIQKAIDTGVCPKEVAFYILDTLPDCPEQTWKHAVRCKGVKSMKAAITALKEQKAKQTLPGLEVQESNQPQPVKVKDALKVFDLWTKAHSEFSGSPFSNGACLQFVQMINKNKKQEGGVSLLEMQAKQIIKDMNHVLESIALFHAQSGTNKTN